MSSSVKPKTKYVTVFTIADLALEQITAEDEARRNARIDARAKEIQSAHAQVEKHGVLFFPLGEYEKMQRICRALEKLGWSSEQPSYQGTWSESGPGQPCLQVRFQK